MIVDHLVFIVFTIIYSGGLLLFLTIAVAHEQHFSARKMVRSMTQGDQTTA